MSLRAAVDATPLLGNRTGVGVFTEQILAALGRRDDVEVAAFAVSWRRRHGIRPFLPPTVRMVERAMPARPLHQAWSHSSHPVIERWTGPIDVVHGTNFVVPPARRAARIVTVHDLTIVRFPELCDEATLGFPRLIRRAIAEGAWVHTPSRYVAAEVVEHFAVDPARVRAIHHGAPPALDADGGSGVLAGGRYILAVGTVEPRKGYPGLVAAFDRLAADRPDVQLVIAGADGWGTAALDEAVADAKFAERIRRLGWVEESARRRLLLDAAVFAYPSVYEGFGLPPLEAMAAGVPVVATDAGALPEVVGDGGVLVRQGDVDALAEALARALDDREHAAALVERGRRRLACFSWDVCAGEFVQLYGDAVAERG